jgi:hypothetical protein
MKALVISAAFPPLRAGEADHTRITSANICSIAARMSTS